MTTSLPLLQHADAQFLKTAGCISCHNNSLFQMTVTAVRRKGFPVDEASVADQTRRMRAYIESWRERVLQDIPIPGRVDTVAYILVGLAAGGYPPDAATDALARYVRRRQSADGGWRIAAQRPPIESSDITATAISLRALAAYAPAPRRREYAAAVDNGARWLAQAQPATTKDGAFQLLGLRWAGADRDTIRKASRALAARQRPDGGWSQTDALASDAYATGQALAAMVESGAFRAADAAYRRGVQFLLNTQLRDGSWWVRSRTPAVQPYFDSEFPHGRDQFVSAAATYRATMALAAAVR